MVPGWMLAAIIMTQAPIAATTGGFATEGQVRSAAHRRRVLEAMLPTDSRSPFILTDSGRSNRPLSINLGGFRADGVLDPTGTTVEWPGAGSDQPFDVRATATRLTFHFLASQSLSFSSPPVVKGNTATINLADGPSFFITVEGLGTWAGTRLDLEQQTRVHVELMVTRQQHADAETPAPAWGAAMAFDERNRRLVRFGGSDEAIPQSAPETTPDLTPEDRTWVFDEHVGWRSLPITSPPGRVRPAMVWDQARSVMVLFAGDTATGYLNDTWEFSNNRWSVRPNVSAPRARWCHSMAFDPIRKRTVLFGGSTTFTMDDTWEWDGNLWLAADAGTPGRRDALGLAWNHTAGSMVLFGGYRGGAGTFADTWSRSGGVAWTAEAPLASPPPRSSLAMAWDPVGRRVVMTGGWLPYQELKQDTWTFDGTTWRQDVDAPYPWFRQALASHPSLGVVAWGGDSDSGPRSDTLYLSPVGWLPVPLTPAEGPCFLDASGTVAGRVMDGSAWTLGRFEWERTHDFPAADITHVVRTPEGLLALSPTASWFDPLDGGWVEAVDGGAHPEPRFLLWDDVLAQLWLVTPAGELYTLNAGGWDLRSVLGPGVRAVAGAPDGGLFILQNEVEHYDPFTATRTPFSPAPPGDAGLTLFFDRRRDLLVSAAPTSATPVAEWDGVAWVQIETAHLPIEFIGARPGGTLVARGGDGDAVIDYEQLRALGSRCAEDRQCAGGFCADGRCCESACSGGMGDCRACSFESGSTEDGHCTTIRPGFVAVCASQPPCLQAVCVPGDPVCPPLSDLSCPLDAGPVQQRDAGRPRSDAGSDQPATAPPCGCASVRGAGLLLLLSLFTRRRGSSPALSPR